MESGYEFVALSELPPLPQVYDPMEYSRSYPYAITALESLPPYPHSLRRLDLLRRTPRLSKPPTTRFRLVLPRLDSSPLSLVTRDYLTESTRLEKLFSHYDVVSPTQFLRLPDLRSFEHTTTTVEENTKPPPFLSLAPPLPEHDVNNQKRRRLRSRVKSTFTISSPPSSSSSKSVSPSPTPSSSSSQSIHGVTRQRRISDKIRSLEKLMQWEKKMNLATILEETHKYITFLQSQIASLCWMPLESV